MNALEFVTKTKELLPDKEKMLKIDLFKNIINESQANFLVVNSILVVEQEPIIWITKNCNIKSFAIGNIYFIESFTIDNYIIFAQAEADYIAINKTTKEIFLIGYEEIDEFLYGDGEKPNFNNKYPLAKNSESFLDILVEKLKYQKVLKENLIMELEKRELVVKPFLEKAINKSGGVNYEPWRIF